MQMYLTLSALYKTHLLIFIDYSQNFGSFYQPLIMLRIIYVSGYLHVIIKGLCICSRVSDIRQLLLLLFSMYDTKLVNTLYTCTYNRFVKPFNHFLCFSLLYLQSLTQNAHTEKIKDVLAISVTDPVHKLVSLICLK